MKKLLLMVVVLFVFGCAGKPIMLPKPNAISEGKARIFVTRTHLDIDTFDVSKLDTFSTLGGGITSLDYPLHLLQEKDGSLLPLLRGKPRNSNFYYFDLSVEDSVYLILAPIHPIFRGLAKNLSGINLAMTPGQSYQIAMGKNSKTKGMGYDWALKDVTISPDDAEFCLDLRQKGMVRKDLVATIQERFHELTGQLACEMIAQAIPALKPDAKFKQWTEKHQDKILEKVHAE